MADRLSAVRQRGLRSLDQGSPRGEAKRGARLTRFIDRRFSWLVLALLLTQSALQVASVMQEAQTWDEAIHLAAGVSYWRTGDLRMNPEHPPLGKLLNAIPVLFLPLRLPLQHPSWRQRDQIEFGAQFLYTNTLPADTILFPARMVTILATGLLGAALAFWTRRHYGAITAVFALLLYAFDPNITAHGRYVTGDVMLCLFSFLAVTALGRALEDKRSAVLAGMWMSCAILTKFSGLFLVPVFLILASIRRPSLKTVAGLAATAALALVPFHSSFAGVQKLLPHYQGGHESYLLGQLSTQGWWYYFPVVFLVKSPATLVVLFALTVILIAARRFRFTFPTLTMLIPAAIYFAFCLRSHLDIGVRHLLPVYPFLFVLIAAACVNSLPRWTTVIAALLLMTESLSIYPDYLAFFNAPSGGPGNGPSYLLDSNVDWGQDTKKLKSYLDSIGVHQVCRAYFGQAILAHYGIVELPLPTTDRPTVIRDLNCVAAISVTLLHGLYVQHDGYRWLRAHQPMARVGYSIYVYDLRKVN